MCVFRLSVVLVFHHFVAEVSAAMGDVRLLGAWTSPFVMRARIALNVKISGLRPGEDEAQESTPPRVQRNLQEDPSPYPQPTADLRVHDHRPVRR